MSSRNDPGASRRTRLGQVAAALLAIGPGCEASPTRGTATGPVVESVVLSTPSSSVAVDDTVTLSVRVLDSLGRNIPGLSIIWSSSEPSVASLSGQGYTAVLTGHAAGSALVKAAARGSQGELTIDVTSLPPPPPPGPLKAFPEAEGWGAMALNECRSLPLRIHFVTNTNNDGPGSLRQVIDEAVDGRFDVIVFRTGGAIRLTERLFLRASCVYLAGQTAPGDGILLRGDGLRLSNIGDVVIRFLRIRDATNNIDVTDTGGARRIMIDHVSASWGVDGNFGVWRTEGSAPPTREISFQRSVSAEVLAGHSAGFLVGGRGSQRGHEGVHGISIHHNLFAHTGQRNPEILSGNPEMSFDLGTEVVNNVQYNWIGRPISSRESSVVDIVGNYSKPGPMSAVLVHRHAFYDADPMLEFPDPSIYIHGNVIEGETFEDQWDMIRDWYSLDDRLPSHFRRELPLPIPPFPISTQTAQDAFQSVLSDVGANARLDCDGSLIPALDPIDLRIIGDVWAGTGYSEGPPTSPEDAGGWPTMAPGEACTDTDLDGLPDAFEQRFAGCATCAVPGSRGRDGYLWVEHFLNGSSP